MDTISRENNSNYLPIAGVILGGLALLIAVVVVVKLQGAGKRLDTLSESVARIDSVEATARSAQSTAEQAKSSSDRANTMINKVANDTSTAFQDVANTIGTIRADVAKIQAPPAKVAGAPGGAKGPAAEKVPVVAGPDEYIVKSKDTGSTIAKAHNVSLADLMAVNPGLNWTKMKVGDKIKLPAKK
jgi:LysM repeat protein